MFESNQESSFNWSAVIVGAIVAVAGTFAVKLIGGILNPKTR